MKKMLCFLATVVICFSACSNVTGNHVVLQESNASLVVCGQEVVGDFHVRIDYEKHTVELPLVILAEALGAEIEWISSNTVDFIFEDTTYRLNLNNVELVDRNVHRGNLLNTSPGATQPGFAQVIDNDVVLDSVRLSHFLILRGMLIRTDYENAVIYIEPSPYMDDQT